MALEFNKPGALCLEGNIIENFKLFKQEVTIYFKATETNKKTNDVQVARLLNLLGQDGLKIYNTITTGKDETVESILEALEEYCIPKTNEIMEHFTFFNRKQMENEQFDGWYTDLKKLIKSCNFGEAEDKILKTQLVLGIFDKETQARLLRDDLELGKVVSYCKAVERAESNRKVLEYDKNVHAVSCKVDGRNKYHQENKWINNKARQGEWREKNMYRHEEKGKTNEFINCNRCGKKHMFKKCPAYGEKCRNCGGFNHYSNMCKKSEKYNDNSKIKKAQEVKIKNEEENVLSVQSVNKLESKKNEWCKEFKVNNVKVNFKLDSGAEINTLSEEHCIELGLLNSIKKSNIVLEVYGGYKMKPIGEVDAILSLDNKSTKTKFIIISNNYKSKPIIGLQILVEFGLIKNVDAVINKIGSSNDKDNFVNDYKDIFEGIGCFPEVCSLKLKKGVVPKASIARRVPLKIKDKLKLKLDELVKKEIIACNDEPSEWVSNLVIVQKPDSSLRICLDPKDLNKSLIRDYFPVPTLEEISAKLIGKKYFSVLDLRDGYYHIKLDELSSKYCSFSTPFGNYRFLRLPFGLNVAPELFMKQNEKYFGDIEGVIIYFDDILVAAESLEQHEEIMSKVVERARKYNIKFNNEKFQYKKNKVKFMGLIFNKEGMSPDTDRVEAIKNLKNPNCKKELQQILGVVNFLRQFIPKMSELIGPLRELLKKNVLWNWNVEHTKILENVKNMISENSLLVHFNVKKSIQIQCDASKDAIACCLMQDNRPVWYASRALTETEQMYAIIEKELLAVTFAVKKFHYFIYGHESVKIYSDHLPLVAIINKKMDQIENNRLKRLKLKLINYNFEIEYLPGKLMFIADLLTRNIKRKDEVEDESMLDIIHVVKVAELKYSNERLSELKLETNNDVILKRVKDYYMNGWPNKLKEESEISKFFKIRSDIVVEDEVVYYGNRVVIPAKLRRQMLKLLHESHQGVYKTKELAKQHVYWPGISADIYNLVLDCNICNKYARSNKKTELLSHEIPDGPFEKIGVDIAHYSGKDYLVLVDYFSRWIEVILLKYKTAQEVIMKCKEVFARFGIPNTLIADNMPFNSYQFVNFTKEWGIQINNSSPYYPVSNGLSEKFVGIAKKMLKKCSDTNGELESFLLSYRNTPLPNIGQSPAKLLQNRVINTKLPSKMEQIGGNGVRAKMNENQLKQKYYFDRKGVVKEVSFIEGEKVWVQNNINKTWSEATIVKKLNLPRSYLVKFSNGRVLRRNISFLRKKRTLSLELDEEGEEKDKNCSNNNVNKKKVIITRYGRRIKQPDRYRS